VWKQLAHSPLQVFHCCCLLRSSTLDDDVGDAAAVWVAGRVEVRQSLCGPSAGYRIPLQRTL
jgi:hypothetical protein